MKRVGDLAILSHVKTKAKDQNKEVAMGTVIQAGSVSKVEIATPMDLIYKVLFPSISAFETPPNFVWWMIEYRGYETGLHGKLLLGPGS